MNMFTLFILVAAAAAIVSLASGLTAMVSNGEVGHRTSAEWMTWRVAFQAGAVALIMLALLNTH